MTADHKISIDPSKPLAEEPHLGHNRWHEEIEAIIEVSDGDTVELETRDGLDGQLNPNSTADDVAGLSLGVAHALTGPVRVRGAVPGDLLEVEILAIEADPFEQWGYTVEIPGFGFLREEFPDPYIVHWRLHGNDYAESDQLAGVRIPCSPFPGTLGVAPSRELRARVTQRENDVLAAGGIALPPDPDGAVPGDGPVASDGLRTVPPRENAGNIDIKQLTPGAKVLLPVHVEGALLSVGDVHYAQGDCEACGTAIEIRSRMLLRFTVRKGQVGGRAIGDLQFYREDYFAPPDISVPKRFFATTGISVDRDGNTVPESITVAAQNALRNMIDHLETRGFGRQEAYAICSVAVDLRISQTVDLPNMLVSAFLPLDIFV